MSRYADVLHVLSAWGGRELSSGGVGRPPYPSSCDSVRAERQLNRLHGEQPDGDDEVQAESDHPRDAYP